MRNMQPEAVDDDRRVTMYYKKFRSLNLSALGLGALRLPMEKDNPNRIDREEGRKVIDQSLSSGINYIDAALPRHKILWGSQSGYTSCV